MNKKRQTIKTRIIRSSLINVLLPMIILGVFSILVSYGSALEYLGENVRSTASTAAESIRWEIKSYQNIALETGGNKRLTDENVSDEDKMATLDSISKGYGFERGNVMDANGDAINGNNYSDRVYFQKAMQGISYVSEPVVSKTTGKISIIVAAPLWKDGIFGGQPGGCVYFVPYEEFLNDITRRLMVQVSDNATAYILNKEGTVIANDDASKVKDGVNYIQLSQSDKSYSDLADVNKKMIAGEAGFMSANVEGKNTIIGYAPIPDSDGWSIAVQAPAADFLFNTYISMIITAVLIIIAIIIAVFTSIKMGHSIGNPVSVCAERLKRLSEGDIKSAVTHFKTNDEMETLAEATVSLVNDLSEIMNDTGNMLTEMAGGNFTVNSEVPEEVYRGDFHVLVDSLGEIKRRLNHTLLQINSAADQVSTGSDQVSSGALALSQGATEQASSIGDLTSFIHTIDARVTQTTESCEEGRRLVGETVDYIGKATEEMHSLTNAMQDINDATEKISKIIKDIEDIAFQTNILSLNAAVEAARAGEAGKGFAVVADEVRNLANKSAEAAHNTTELIERTVAAVANGTSIAAKTSEAVNSVEERSSEVNSIVNNIAEASAEQSGMVKQITSGMEQISNAVQTISATAEESAAASDELSNQAQTLKTLVGAFKLNTETQRTIDLE